jgi:hypothetical protein
MLHQPAFTLGRWAQIFNGALLFLSALLTVPLSARAQDQCAELLKRGIYDHLFESGASSTFSATKNEICRAYNEYLSSGQTAGADAQYGLFNGSVSYSSNQIKSIGEAMCNLSQSTFNASDFAQRNQSIISSAAVSAWESCIQHSNRKIEVETEFHDTDQGAIGLTVTLFRSGVGAGHEEIRSIIAKNLTCNQGTLSALVNRPAANVVPLDSTSRAIICERDVAARPFTAGSRVVYADDSRLTIETTAGTVERRLPAILPPPPISVVPRGTVVAWYSKSGPVPAGWTICDGTNGTPDLRDRFLMGTASYADVGNKDGKNKQAAVVSIERLELATGGGDHPYAMRVDGGNGVINHQTLCGGCNLVNSFTRSGSGKTEFDNRPAFTSVIYIMKL